MLVKPISLAQMCSLDLKHCHLRQPYLPCCLATAAAFATTAAMTAQRFHPKTRPDHLEYLSSKHCPTTPSNPHATIMIDLIQQIHSKMQSWRHQSHPPDCLRLKLKIAHCPTPSRQNLHLHLVHLHLYSRRHTLHLYLALQLRHHHCSNLAKQYLHHRCPINLPHHLVMMLLLWCLGQ